MLKEKQSKQFFFEKKNQKTFANFALRLGLVACLLVKVFASFFKKKRFLLLRAVRHECEGVVSLEFAIIAPVMLLMVMGAYDAGRALIVWQEVQTASNWIARSAAVLAVASDQNSSQISIADANLAMTAVYAAMPGLKLGFLPGAFSVTLSAVEYATDPACQFNCGIVPQTAWTVSLPAAFGNSASLQRAVRRPCGVLAAVDHAPSTIKTLAVIGSLNVTQPGSILVADVRYQFTPIFYRFMTGTLDFWQTAYSPPLGGAVNQEIDYDLPNYLADIGPNGPVCPANTPGLTFR